MVDELQDAYEVVVVGGGAAGLNGALMLGRSRRSVVVLDSGAPRNAPADAVHGLFAREGTPPAELLARGRAEVRQYGGHVVEAEVVDAERVDDGFVVRLADGRQVHGQRLLVTSGLVDQLPDVPGLAERWGRDLIHCPYCHGYEVRDRAIGVLAVSPMSVHQALLLRQLSADVTVLANGVAFPVEALEQLAARGIPVVEGDVAEVLVEDDAITGVRLADGAVVAREVLATGSHAVARTGFLGSLGLTTVEHPSGMGVHLPVDAFGKTEVPGVWAAGNVADIAAQVGSSAAAGAWAGAQINADLVMAETTAAVEARRAVAV
ncbi:NAD(P)/FAD-dependent oxidoreductase [Angustibacter speluncae]